MYRVAGSEVGIAQAGADMRTVTLQQLESLQLATAAASDRGASAGIGAT